MDKRFYMIAGMATVLMGALVPAAAARAIFSHQDQQIVDQRWPKAITTWTGLKYIVLKEGSGPTPQSGDLVKVLYKGSLLDGTVFDQTKDPTKPYEFRLGQDSVIPGWEEAIAHMKKGEKRLLIIPYGLGYGMRGSPPVIPRMATLIFEVEVVDIVHGK